MRHQKNVHAGLSSSAHCTIRDSRQPVVHHLLDLAISAVIMRGETNIFPLQYV
jgi:hypothetical protein